MARQLQPWSDKVLALIRGGNCPGALAQIRAAPSLKDLQRLHAALMTQRLLAASADLEPTIADQIKALSAPRLHRSP